MVRHCGWYYSSYCHLHHHSSSGCKKSGNWSSYRRYYCRGSRRSFPHGTYSRATLSYLSRASNYAISRTIILLSSRRSVITSGLYHYHSARYRRWSASASRSDSDQSTKNTARAVRNARSAYHLSAASRNSNIASYHENYQNMSFIRRSGGSSPLYLVDSCYDG